MSFYTKADIDNYRAGWLETHDEVLDDETIIDCLKDEHTTLIDALIENDLEPLELTDKSDSDSIEIVLFFGTILSEGFVGYEEMTVGELWEEAYERGLTI
jgi:hypothetical protein